MLNDMKAYSARGGNLEKMYSKSYNLAVPISLGNKWFTVDRVVALVQFSLQYTKEYVIVYVADDIHAINIEVRNRRSQESSLKKARVMGEKILDELKEKIESNIDDIDKQKIIYAHWSGFQTDSYKEKLDYLYNKYKSDISFRREILSIVESFLENETKEFTEEDKTRLGEYIIEELPELIARVSINGLSFDANIYPTDGRLLEFVEEIQQGKIFNDVRDVLLDTEPKVFIEVY